MNNNKMAWHHKRRANEQEPQGEREREQENKKTTQTRGALDRLRLGEALREVGACGPRADEALGLEGHHRPRKETQRPRVLREVAQHVGRVEELDLRVQYIYNHMTQSKLQTITMCCPHKCVSLQHFTVDSKIAPLEFENRDRWAGGN